MIPALYLVLSSELVSQLMRLLSTRSAVGDAGHALPLFGFDKDTVGGDSEDVTNKVKLFGMRSDCCACSRADRWICTLTFF